VGCTTPRPRRGWWGRAEIARSADCAASVSSTMGATESSGGRPAPTKVRRGAVDSRLMTVAIYPGSFDPLTLGHLDVIERGARLFSRLVVAVATNDSKAPLFTADERVAMLRRALDERRIPKVEVTAFDGLIVDFARARGADVLLRGVRTVTDFEYEWQMALMNRDLAPAIETVFLMPSLAYSYVSSRLIKESVRLGADVTHHVPDFVHEALRTRLRERSARGNNGGTA
jgi:pantetheine-phosphate adenylyltransferase